ncbi:hypothetical protein IMSAGC013_01807 [Lachnospiraceae bacterium]|nr:hypothetical protein IMSAGC013_01807 [Lachnospiraceae bacterium]
MKKKSLRIVIVLLLFATVFMPFFKIDTNAAPAKGETVTKAVKVKKPGQVKGLKKVKEYCKWDGYRNISYVKIKFNKVKGATGYQVLIYKTHREPGYQTPLVYAKTTKKTSYTINNLLPDVRYTVKIKAYTKGKNGKIVYGKVKSIKFKTGGKKKGLYYTCDSCVAAQPGNMNIMLEHVKSVYKIHKEIHAGGTYFWK